MQGVTISLHRQILWVLHTKLEACKVTASPLKFEIQEIHFRNDIVKSPGCRPQVFIQALVGIVALSLASLTFGSWHQFTHHVLLNLISMLCLFWSIPGHTRERFSPRKKLNFHHGMVCVFKYLDMQTVSSADSNPVMHNCCDMLWSEHTCVKRFHTCLNDFTHCTITFPAEFQNFLEAFSVHFPKHNLNSHVVSESPPCQLYSPAYATPSFLLATGLIDEQEISWFGWA